MILRLSNAVHFCSAVMVCWSTYWHAAVLKKGQNDTRTLFRKDRFIGGISPSVLGKEIQRQMDKKIKNFFFPLLAWHVLPSGSRLFKVFLIQLQINTLFLFFKPYPRNPVYARRLDPSVLTISLSLHRNPFICILFNSLFTSYNK